jgi:hypothetical protein
VHPLERGVGDGGTAQSGRRDTDRDPDREIGPPEAPDVYGEYSSPRLRLPGWGLASILFALPGALLPWILPEVLGRVGWSTVRPFLLVIPVSALIGGVLGAVGIRREDGGTAALVGLALNVVLLLLVAAVVVILVF